MKITKLTTYRLPPRWMFLKIETDEGIVGWGEPVIEGKAKSVEAAVHELGEYIIGQIQRELMIFGRHSIEEVSTAVALF